MGVIGAIIRRDLRLALRQGVDVTLALAFFLIAASLFPLGVGPTPELLTRISPGIIWVLALLAVMLSLDRIFQADYDDGSLELMALSPQPLILVAAAKSIAHWITTGLPLVALAPVIALLFNFPIEGYGALIFGLLLGTPALSFIGGIGAALVLGARRAGPLTALLVLPLYIPVLIFGVSAVDAALNQIDPTPHLLILAALLAGSLALGPVAAAAAIRASFR